MLVRACSTATLRRSNHFVCQCRARSDTQCPAPSSEWRSRASRMRRPARSPFPRSCREMQGSALFASLRSPRARSCRVHSPPQRVVGGREGEGGVLLLPKRSGRRPSVGPGRRRWTSHPRRRSRPGDASKSVGSFFLRVAHFASRGGQTETSCPLPAGLPVSSLIQSRPRVPARLPPSFATQRTRARALARLPSTTALPEKLVHLPLGALLRLVPSP